MKEALVTVKTAKLLKELGFNLDTLHWYDVKGNLHSNPIKNHNKEKFAYSAPSQCLALKWIREKYRLYPVVQAVTSDGAITEYYIWAIYKTGSEDSFDIFDDFLWYRENEFGPVNI